MNITGLNPSQVLTNRKKYGKNIIPMPPAKRAWQFFTEVFQDKINLILLIMLVLFGILAAIGVGDIYEFIGIAGVLIIVSIISVITQLRTQRSARALLRAANEHKCRVIRGGVIHNIDSTDVVIDDIIILGAGEIICADGYIIDGAITVNNSILNGESDECEKSPVKNYKYNPNAPITSETFTDKNSLFSGTTVLGGTGKMRVTRIGAHTQNATILTSIADIDTVKTSLQIQIDQIADKISKIGGIAAVALFAVLIIHEIIAGTIGGGMSALHTILGNAMIGLTLFVAAVPEGLPFIVSIITSRNTGMLIKNHILAKNPHKIPAAGNLHIICTDKTGTLTFGNMAVVENCMGNGEQIPQNGPAAELFRAGIATNTDATFDATGAIVGGNSTDRAILATITHADARTILRRFSITKHIPFNSANKFMASVVHDKTAAHDITFVRGAPERVLEKCRDYIDGAGNVHRLNRVQMDKIIREYAARAMRIVATAYINGAASGDAMPDNMTLIGICAMRDEIRPDVPKSIAMLERAGISVMMITGDNIDTARAIARECGIISDDKDIAINDTELNQKTDAWIKKHITEIKVIARATPATKLRVVKLAQQLNKTIGMCGDGTNDAPALRRADVGFAMGDGTDVCKEASDIIITNNDFSAVAECVLIGRTFLRNVKSFLGFQLPINFCLVTLCIAMPLLFDMDAFCAVQILIINVVMDSLNSLSFGGEPPHAEYMNTPAPPKDAPLLSRRGIIKIAVHTIMFIAIFAILMSPMVRGMFDTPDTYMAARFALLVLMAIFNGFNIRTDGYNILRGLGRNRMFVYIAISVVLGCVLCVTYGGPALGVAPLNITQWAIVFGLALMIIPMDLVRKILFGKGH